MELDALTGLPSRLHLRRLLDEAAAGVPSDAVPLSLLLIDLDRFKGINDACGHDTGDIVLRELAGLLQKHLLSPRISGRLGGNEFLALLPRTPLADACIEAEALRASIERHRFSTATGALTASIGIATSPIDQAWSAQQLVQLADLRLIVAKKRLERSRNRVWAGMLPASWHESNSRFRNWPTLEILPGCSDPL